MASIYNMERRFLFGLTATVFMGIGVWAGSTGAAGRPAAKLTMDEITVKRLVVVDEQGKQCIFLGTDEDGSAIGIRDKSGSIRVGLFCHETTGGDCIVYDKKGRNVAQLK